MNLWRQLVDVARRVPGYLLGAPTRWLVRAHGSPGDDGTGSLFCLAHKRPVEWPCREYLDALETLHERPAWRLHG